MTSSPTIAPGRALVVALLAAACSTTPVPTGAPPDGTSALTDPSGAPDELGPPKQASARLNDVVVTLAIEHDRAPAGRQIRARVEVTNAGFGFVSWQSGGCGLFNGFALSGPDIPQPPPGREWEGTAHWAKWSATTSGVGLVGFVPPDIAARGQPWMYACPADLRVEDIGPGETASVDAVWVGFASDGQPAPGGPYALSYTFPFLARVPKEQFRGDPLANVKPIKVTVDFSIDAGRGVAIPSTLAFDAALSDPRVANWISRVTREQLGGASVILDRGLWQITIRIDSGAAEIMVDPSSGAVVSVKLP